MTITLDIPAVILARQSPVVLPCAQLPALDAAVKAGGGNIGVLERGTVSAPGPTRTARSGRGATPAATRRA